MQPIKSLLGGALNRKEIQDGVRASVILDAAKEAVESVLPFRVASKVTPISYRNKALLFQVPHPAVAQELRMNTRQIIALIEERRGKECVQYIKIRVSRQPFGGVIG